LCISVVIILQKYADDGLVSVVQNVFDFDAYNSELRKTITTTLYKHGIPIGTDPHNIHLAKQFPLPSLQHVGQWTVRKTQALDGFTGTFSCPVEKKRLSLTDAVQLTVQSFPMERKDARSRLFSEQEAFWYIPLHETSSIVDVAVSQGKLRQRLFNVNDL